MVRHVPKSEIACPEREREREEEEEKISCGGLSSAKIIIPSKTHFLTWHKIEIIHSSSQIFFSPFSVFQSGRFLQSLWLFLSNVQESLLRGLRKMGLCAYRCVKVLSGSVLLPDYNAVAKARCLLEDSLGHPWPFLHLKSLSWNFASAQPKS